MNRRAFVTLGLVLIVLGATACGTSSSLAKAKSNSAKTVRVYVALGGSESSELNFHQFSSPSWTQVLYRSVYGTNGVFYDLAVPGATIGDVLEDQLPIALGLHPSLVTIWANAFDLIEGTSSSTYANTLGAIVHKLHTQHIKVLVANATPVEQFPIYASCLVDPRGCSISHNPLPMLSALAQSERQYDVEITKVARTDGASVVDVESLLIHAIANTNGPAPLTTNGTGLSDDGAKLIANAFEKAMHSAATQKLKGRLHGS